MEEGTGGKMSDRSREEKGFQRRLFMGLAALCLLTPLGIVIPRIFNAGEPFGEWGPEQLRQILGYAPERLSRTAHIWHAPFAGYTLGGNEASFASQLFFYFVAGLSGLVLIALGVVLLAKVARRHER